MEFIGKIGDPMESDGERLPDLGEVPVRSDFPEAFGQIRVSLALTVGPWAGHLAPGVEIAVSRQRSLRVAS
jgi:hypothetical protein